MEKVNETDNENELIENRVLRNYLAWSSFHARNRQL